MGRSVSYAAYRALSRRKSLSGSVAYAPRPTGELVWMHAASAARFDALCDLAIRLKSVRPDVRVLLTLPPDASPPKGFDTREGIDCIAQLDEDHPEAARRFLDHWQPDLCLWTGGNLGFNLIVASSAQGIPLILLDITSEALKTQALGWLRGPQKRVLGCFQAVLAADKATAAHLRKLGVSASRIEVTGPLRAGVTPPSCRDEVVAESTRQLSGRPVWLAAHLPQQEAQAILAAHRQAVRLSHRLLLIIHPASDDQAAAIADAVRASALRAVVGTSADTIDENTQVLVAEDCEELGLWYRVAPLSFMGGTFSGATTTPNPMHAAALGSAVLYGPRAAPDHAEAFERLTRAGAARMVHDSEALGQATVHLIAPDQAAEMALAGWEVVTEGAELADQVLERVQDLLDAARVAHARS